MWIDPPLEVGSSAAGRSYDVAINGRAMTLDVPFKDTDTIELGPWLSIALDRLAAWRDTTQRSVPSERTPQMRMATEGYDGAIGGGESPTFGIYLPRRPRNKQLELHAAFVAASEGVELPLDRQLFAEALAYGEAARWRQAIISACSAVEVTLDREARRLLDRAGHSDADRDAIMRRTSGVMELYRIAETRRGGLGVSFERASDQIARPRNDAVHAGHALDEPTTQRAIETAAAVIAVAPLRAPLSFLREAQGRSTAKRRPLPLALRKSRPRRPVRAVFDADFDHVRHAAVA